MPATNPAEDRVVGSIYPAHAVGRSLASGLLDRRTREWRRRCELVQAFIDALGGPDGISPVLQAKAETAAELAVTAELTRARFMAGDAICPGDVSRTANQAVRAEKALGIGMKPAKPLPSFAERLKAGGAQ